jgi:uncharacterized protein YaiI (UPF0178 family)
MSQTSGAAIWVDADAFRPSFGQRDRQAFANALDRWLAARMRQA